MYESKIKEIIDDLTSTQLGEALVDFLKERRLTGEFLIWLEKRKKLILKGK